MEYDYKQIKDYYFDIFTLNRRLKPAFSQLAYIINKMLVYTIICGIKAFLIYYWCISLNRSQNDGIIIINNNVNLFNLIFT